MWKRCALLTPGLWTKVVIGLQAGGIYVETCEPSGLM
jgi:hypothetical protein